MSKRSKVKRPEIMAPAGDFACLSAAIGAGADAVYFGAKGFNMRSGAKNFTMGGLKKVASMCAEAAVKSYLTVNTIWYEGEAAKLDSLLETAAAAKIDAVIAWDFSVLSRAEKFGLPVFLSTQASVSNSDAIVAYYRKFGIRRFVLARECSLADIVKIKRSLVKKLGGKDASEIKIEVFAHGAMCVSESGRCFMSGFQCGKSANRGECIQPCRREYSIADKDGNSFAVDSSGFVLSPRDLCTLGFLEKLVESGADSLKIEGRNRNAEYVYATVSAYKKVRDFYIDNRREPNFAVDFAALKADCLKSVARVFNRGFSDGFYMGKPVGDWTSSGSCSTAKKAIVGHVERFYPKLSVAEVSIDVESVSEGDTVQFEGEKTGFFETEISSLRADGNPSKTAGKGSAASFFVPRAVRRFDRVYKLVSRT